MGTRQLHSDIYSTYFITFTCIDWIPLFQLSDGYNFVYEWFEMCKERYDAHVVAFVIMPNHVHFILHFRNAGFNLNKVISNGKRFIAYKIIRRLQERKADNLLEQLQHRLTDRDKEKHQIHRVFKESFDAKPIYSEKFLRQKMDYIHYNPVSKKWNLASDYIAYEHSSAAFYETGVVKYFKPLHFMDL